MFVRVSGGDLTAELCLSECLVESLKAESGGDLKQSSVCQSI